MDYFTNGVFLQQENAVSLIEVNGRLVVTDGPGFIGDEPYETLGKNLSLPPFLEPKRAEIDKLVRPLIQ